jgi:hypothetical protein
MAAELKLSQQLKIFVSSKTRLREERAAAQQAIEELHMVPVLVDMESWIASTEPEEWLAQLRECDLMVLILEEGLDPKDAGREAELYRFVEQEIDLAASLGKPLLLFLRTADPGEPRTQLAERMFGRTYGRRFDTVVELGRALQEAILSEVFRRYRTRSVAVPNREAFYVAAADLARKAQRRVYLGAETPVVFFGPRKRLGFENDFFEATMEFIAGLREATGRDRECVVFFNEASVRRELSLVRQHYDPELIVRNLQLLDEVWRSGGRLQLLPTLGPHTFALFDDTYIVWIRSGPLWFGTRDRSPEVCEGLQKLVHRMAEEALVKATESANEEPVSDPAHWLRIFQEAIGPASA